MSISTTDFSLDRAGQRNWFDRLAYRMTTAWEGHARRMSRCDKIAALNAKSDAELAGMGLCRADIPRHVFRDLLYI